MEQEKRFKIYIRDSFKCKHPGCKKIGTERIELAHKIHQGVQSENWIKKYVKGIYNIDLTNKELKKIIHHPYNIETSCRKHNDYFNCLFQTEDAKKIIDKIIREEYVK